ncbi:MAG: DUF3305 domain-containing protein [Gammaproteobacteria bacterium]|nr:DUF3305 domain-containing protein [Gammaproteobacteria bacterium]
MTTTPAAADDHAGARAAFTESAREVTVPVAVILQRETAAAEKWAHAQWSAFAVVAGAHLAHGDAPVLIHDEGGIRRYFCGGMSLRLYKDGGESYWHNLLSEPPRLFVICDGEQGDEHVSPAFITADQDEASGCMESERLVLSAPMPPSICDVVERYVISHYRPMQKRKRKRREWAEESVYAKNPGAAE